jgi:hypothetical protein
MTNLYKSIPVRSSEITSKQVYLSRRDFMKASTSSSQCGATGSLHAFRIHDGRISVRHARSNN